MSRLFSPSPLARILSLALPLVASTAFASSTNVFTNADCGVINGVSSSSTTDHVTCAASGRDVLSNGELVEWRITASASQNRTLPGVAGVSATMQYTNLFQRNSGATSSFLANAGTKYSYQDKFNFTVDGAPAGQTFTLVTVLAMDGGITVDVDAERFANGQSFSAWAILNHSFGDGDGLEGTSSLGQKVSVHDGVIDNSIAIAPTFFTREIQTNQLTTLGYDLSAYVYLNNSAVSGDGVGTGGADVSFLHTAGIVSFELLDANGQSVDFSFTTASGEFAFFEPAAPVPEPATWAMMLAGLGLAGLARRRVKG